MLLAVFSACLLFVAVTDGVSHPKCTGGKVWVECACERTCQKPTCAPNAGCSHGCLCVGDLFLDETTGNCVPLQDCKVPPNCPTDSTFSGCGFCGVQRTCPTQKTERVEERRCLSCSTPACYCTKTDSEGRSYVIDENTNKCVPRSECS